MSALARGLALFVIVFHVAIFVLEAWLWMRPEVYEPALAHIAAPSALSFQEQARVLRPVLVNQGFYNLFLAGAGVSGLLLYTRGRRQAGSTLIHCMCLTAVSAGLVLALTTRAYVGALLQAVPALLALLAGRAQFNTGN